MNDARKELARISRRLARRLKQGREWRNFSIEGLAQKSGVKIRILERSERAIPAVLAFDDLDKVARALDLPIDFFVDG